MVLERLVGARVGDVVPLQEGFQQFRVRTAAVVALAVVFQHQLPVGLFHQGGLHRHLGVLHVVGFHVVGQGGEEVIDGWRVLGQADEDVATGGLHVHRLEPVLLHVEVGAHLGTGEQQAPVQLVGPLVVMADQLGDLALVAGAQAGTAMAADVVEGMHLAFGTAHHQDRVLADLQGDEVALGRDFAGHPGDQPFLLENFFHVDLEQALVAIERLWQREGSLAALQHLGSRLARRFQWIAQTQSCGDVHRVGPHGQCLWPVKVANRCYGDARHKYSRIICDGVCVRRALEPYPWAT
ncbi:hypothetical protein D3C78_807740 [compost metagenome]